jgi:predicted aspartyl protease
MGRDAFKPKHASSVSISEVIDTGVNSNLYATTISPTIPDKVSAP